MEDFLVLARGANIIYNLVVRGRESVSKWGNGLSRPYRELSADRAGNLGHPVGDERGTSFCGDDIRAANTFYKMIVYARKKCMKSKAGKPVLLFFMSNIHYYTSSCVGALLTFRYFFFPDNYGTPAQTLFQARYKIAFKKRTLTP